MIRRVLAFLLCSVPVLAWADDFPLGPATNRIDYQSIDPLARRLYIAKMGAGHLLAVDLEDNHIVADLPGFLKATGVLAVPELHRVYVSVPGAKHPHGLTIAPGAAIGYIACDDNDRLLTVDLSNGKVLDDKPLGHDPDVLDVDQATNRLYVASESGTLSSFDIAQPTAPAALGDRVIGPNAHSVAVDPKTHRLYFRSRIKAAEQC